MEKHEINKNDEMNSLSSDSSISDDGRATIEYVLDHGSPPEALTPSEDRLVVINADSQIPSSSSSVPNSWISRIKSAGANMMESMSQKKEKKHNWKTKFWSTWNNIKYSSTWMSDRTDEYGGKNEVWLLGRIYYTDDNFGFNEFCSDYYSRIWITYRTNFLPLLDSETTSDCGWGCMIRTTQMMIAQCIIVNRLGRDWRFTRRKKSVALITPPDSTIEEEEPIDRLKMFELMILKLFEDKPSSPLGIHQMVKIASEQKGKQAVGCWYTPSEAVHIMKTALSISTSPLTGDISMFLSMDGKVHIGDIERETKNWTKTLILVIVLRLGASELNPIYVAHLRRLFSLSSFLGITGGKPDHSCWFIGYYGDQVIYLDPHVAHNYVPFENDFQQQVPQKPVEKSYHCKLLSKMHFLDMDPSCAVCFRFEDAKQFQSDMKILNMEQFIDIDLGENEGMKRVRDPMFSVVYGERRREELNYDCDDFVSEQEREQAKEQGFEIL
ncbi:unnamed protein product [Caenorhabditis angaria]|uniref:Cysteine protease n=1 Tax=Caenorhabditis angaria TaxID=860376 RepID=A0A9P1MZA4_9PELO|nr:unnamed protein product [Caenorhabditis angaria]